MASTTYTPRMVAREVSKRIGRDYDAKRVRAWVRDNVPAYDDDGYTAHVYDRRTFDRIVAALVSKARTGRATAASKGRASKAGAPKPRTTGTRKAPAMGNGPTPRASKRQMAADAPQAPDA